MIQKSDGAFTYTTSDLATVKYRVEHFKPYAMLYVVDSRQADHFKNFFASVRSRQPVVEDAVFGYRAAGAALLTNLSIDRGQIVRWDPDAMKLL